MSAKAKSPLLISAILSVIFIGIITCVSCGEDNVPYNTKYIDQFHSLTTKSEGLNITPDNLSLFVDYSNCIAKAMQSPFYQCMVSPLTAATKHYWSIKGDVISEEAGSVYSLLNHVEETDYAALDKAIEQMANCSGESVMLTDGELFTKNAAKNNPNNPYMHAAFKQWLLKGHDIHILAEPYLETYKGQKFNKKRFYIIFTDDRMPGNIFDRITELVDFEEFPEIDTFHLSGNYPWIVPTNEGKSHLNDMIVADITHRGAYEIQDWQIDWENITNLITYATDTITGELLPNGDKLIDGLHINRNAFGCYRIKDIEVRVSNINHDYFNLYNMLEADTQIDHLAISPIPVEEFLIYDVEEFNRHGNVDLYFDVNNFAPFGVLDGKPFNYLKIEIAVKSLDNILNNNIDIFNFDSVVNHGQTNVSISESLKNCVFDPDLINKLSQTVLYTIYVKSDKY